MKRNIGIVSAMLLGASVYAAEAPTVSGFVHGLTSFTDTDQNGNKGDVSFSVKDAAVYFQHTVGSAKVMADLPFATSSTSGAVVLDPESKGQAYVSSSTGQGVKWKLGQFDTPFGLEANDSVDRTFNTDGAVPANMPLVHRGLSFGYDASEMVGVELFVANPTNAFSGAPAAPSLAAGSNNDKVETGLNIAAKMDNLALNIGGMYARAVKKHHYGVFTNMKYTMDALMLGVEFDYIKDATSNANASAEEILTALHLGYAMSDVMNIGLRGEYLKHKDASIWTATVGPQVAIEKDVSLKLDYQVRNDMNNYAAGNKGGPKNYTHTVAFGAVARF